MDTNMIGRSGDNMSHTDGFICPVFKSNLFSWDKKALTLTASWSAVRSHLRQLRSDSMDLGFGIQSNKTGNVAYFVLVSATRRDDDQVGEVEKWIYTAHGESLRTQPQLHHVKVVVINE
jgi:hypothetical protein